MDLTKSYLVLSMREVREAPRGLHVPSPRELTSPSFLSNRRDPKMSRGLSIFDEPVRYGLFERLGSFSLLTSLSFNLQVKFLSSA